LHFLLGSESGPDAVNCLRFLMWADSYMYNINAHRESGYDIITVASVDGKP